MSPGTAGVKAEGGGACSQGEGTALAEPAGGRCREEAGGME